MSHEDSCPWCADKPYLCASCERRQAYARDPRQNFQQPKINGGVWTKERIDALAQKLSRPRAKL